MTSFCDQRFPGDQPESIGAFRRMVVEAMAGLPAAVVESARLVASELGTNAEEYSRSGLPGGVFLAKVEIGAVDVLIQITDQGSDTEIPEVREDLDLMAESGRGLRICRRLGEIQTETTPDGGRRVGVRIPIPADESGGRS